MTTPTPRILIVEDQFLVAADCELQLCSAGFDCVGMASTAAQAIELAGSARPDLIVMDINLADGDDGVHAAIAIYEQYGIRCIFASGDANAAVHAAAEPAHPLGWLDKPYSGEKLLSAINEGLKDVGRS